MTFREFLGFAILLISTEILFAEDTVNATDASKRIVILGDSITAGYGLDPGEAYPALLQAKINSAKLSYTIVNAGVSGDTTAGGLRRVSWAMGRGADFLIIALGGNDGLRGISPKETKKNLLGIIKKANSKNPDLKIFLAGMRMPDSMGSDFTTRFKALFPKAAEESNATLIPFLLEGVGGIEKLNQPDGIHPTGEGQKVISETIWKILQPALTSENS